MACYLEVFRKLDDEWTVQVIGSGESLELDLSAASRINIGQGIKTEPHRY